MGGADSEEQQEEWVNKIKFHAGLPPSQQLTSYKAFDEASEQNVEVNSEPLYANIPASGPNNLSESPNSGPNSPPLPETMPPPSWGAQGTRDVLKGRNSLTTPGSREPITGPPNSGAIYANVGQVPRNAGDRSSTLPVQGNRVSIGSSEGDSLDGANHQSGKEKKGSVLGRIETSFTSVDHVLSSFFRVVITLKDLSIRSCHEADHLPVTSNSILQVFLSV